MYLILCGRKRDDFELKPLANLVKIIVILAYKPNPSIHSPQIIRIRRFPQILAGATESDNVRYIAV